MAPQNRDGKDIAMALKAICLSRSLSGVDKAVAAAILDHFNRKSGQCDPSNERLARKLGIDERTVRRATSDLCVEGGLFKKTSHGGKSSRASYTPQWSVLRAVVTEWDRGMRSDFAADNRAKSPGLEAENEGGEQGEIVRQTGRNGPVEQGEIALQTNLSNQSYNQIGTTEPSQGVAARENSTSNSGQISQGLLSKEVASPKAAGYEARERSSTRGCSRSDAAWQAASRRLDAAIASEDRAWQSDMWVLTDETDRNQAITAELKRRGEGIACLQTAVRLARLRAGGSGHVH